MTIVLPPWCRTVHCLSGSYGMRATVKGHYLDEAPTGKTLCGRQTDNGRGRWTWEYSNDRPLGKYDCQRCKAAMLKLQPGVMP